MHREEELVLRARAGDAEAFGELAERCRPWLRALCHRLVHDPWIVDDLVQEALLLAFRDLHQLRDPARFRPWLSQVARNACRMHLRRVQAQPEVLAAEVGETTAPWPQWLEAWEAVAAVGEDGRLLRLRYVEGLSVAEIAARVSLSLPAVRSRLYRARTRLRKELVAMAPATGKKRGKPWKLHTILMVEPEEVLRTALRDALTTAGYEVVLLPTGEAAIEAVHQQQGQMLILDKHCVTPHWLEVMGLVRTEEYGLRNVPICALVDPNGDRDTRLAWHAGAMVCLHRPPQPERVVGYVKHLQENWTRPEGWRQG